MPTTDFKIKHNPQFTGSEIISISVGTTPPAVGAIFIHRETGQVYTFDPVSMTWKNQGTNYWRIFLHMGA